VAGLSQQARSCSQQVLPAAQQSASFAVSQQARPLSQHARFFWQQSLGWLGENPAATRAKPTVEIATVNNLVNMIHVSFVEWNFDGSSKTGPTKGAENESLPFAIRLSPS
jgi:hypothetical protein